MCIASACLAIALMPFASSAQSLQSARVLAEPFPLTADAAATTVGKIWADKLPLLIEQQKALVQAVPSLPMKTEVFIATLKTVDGTFVISAINSSECHSISTVQNERDCPARLARVTSNNEVHVLGEQSDFPIAMVRGNAGFDASSNSQNTDRTIVTFNPTTKTFSYQLFHDGRSVETATVFNSNRL